MLNVFDDNSDWGLFVGLLASVLMEAQAMLAEHLISQFIFLHILLFSVQWLSSTRSRRMTSRMSNEPE